MTGKDRVPLESEEQAALFRWAWSAPALKSYPQLEFLQGSLNGVRMTIGQAVKAKKQGLRRGWPDVFLPVRTLITRHTGLFIELKRLSGVRVSNEQKATHAFLRDQGFLVCVCLGADAAIKVIIDYLRE